MWQQLGMTLNCFSVSHLMFGSYLRFGSDSESEPLWAALVSIRKLPVGPNSSLGSCCRCFSVQMQLCKVSLIIRHLEIWPELRQQQQTSVPELFLTWDANLLLAVHCPSSCWLKWVRMATSFYWLDACCVGLVTNTLCRKTAGRCSQPWTWLSQKEGYVARMILLQLQLVPELCGFFKAGSSVLNNVSNTKVRGTGRYQAMLSTCWGQTMSVSSLIVTQHWQRCAERICATREAVRAAEQAGSSFPVPVPVWHPASLWEHRVLLGCSALPSSFPCCPITVCFWMLLIIDCRGFGKQVCGWFVMSFTLQVRNYT